MKMKIKVRRRGRHRKHHRLSRKKVFLTLFYVYLVMLLYFLFFSNRYGRTVRSEGYRYNLKPFDEISRYIKHRSSINMEYFLVNIFGNVLAFAPFGFLLPMIWKKLRHFLPAVLITAVFSLCIECFQLITRVGSFDVDDIILNTAGGIIGYVIFWFTYGRKLKYLGENQ